jgi:branched-chain amino acid transport system permease protein
MIAKEVLSRIDPAYWFGYIGVFLILVVMFARGGILGLLDQAVARVRRRA